jgi:hypothetical protein
VLTKLIKKLKLTTLLQQIYNRNLQNKPSIPQLCYFSSATLTFQEKSFFFPYNVSTFAEDLQEESSNTD